MNIERTTAIVIRGFFFVAFGLLALAVGEAVAHTCGYTILDGQAPGRLLEYAVILLIFVVALLLRQIRDRIAKA